MRREITLGGDIAVKGVDYRSFDSIQATMPFEVVGRITVFFHPFGPDTIYSTEHAVYVFSIAAVGLFSYRAKFEMH